MHQTLEQAATPTEDRPLKSEDADTRVPQPPEAPVENPETDELAEVDSVLADEAVLAEEDEGASHDDADVESADADEMPATPVVDAAAQADRARLAERIRNSRKLPKGLRDRLGELVETLQLSGDANPTPTVPVAEAVEMIEAAIPENLQFAHGPLESPAHPRGENFFSGNSQELSDAEAQRIAAEQLAATGFARRA